MKRYRIMATLAAIALPLMTGCWPLPDQSEYVQEVCTETVRSVLKAPSTLRVTKSYLSSSPGGGSKVTLSYEASNAMGVPLADAAVCTFKIKCTEAKWSCIDLTGANIYDIPIEVLSARAMLAAMAIDERSYFDSARRRMMAD